MFLSLLTIFFKVGFFAFGGGWAIVGILRNEIVSKGILSAEEFTEVLSVAQITPGPIAINLATYTGYRYFGILGAIMNTFVFLLAPLLIISILFLLARRVRVDKERWSRALLGITTVMVTVTMYSLFVPNIRDLLMVSIAVGVFLCIWKYKIHPLILILLSGFIGAVFYGLL